MTLHRMFQRTLRLIEMSFIKLWLPIGAILKLYAFNAMKGALYEPNLRTAAALIPDELFS